MYENYEIIFFNDIINDIIKDIKKAKLIATQTALPIEKIKYYVEILQTLLYVDIDINKLYYEQLVTKFCKAFSDNITYGISYGNKQELCIDNYKLYKMFLKDKNNILLKSWFTNKINNKRLGIFFGSSVSNQPCKTILSSYKSSGCKNKSINIILDRVTNNINQKRRENIPVEVPLWCEDEYLYINIVEKLIVG
jgi:hypothetical protein